MSRNQSFSWRRLGFAMVLVSSSVLGAAAAVSTPVSLPESIRAVPLAPGAGPVNPHQAYMTRAVLRADETAASMEFEVALKMRNFSELQARVAKGERISSQEMAARYDPSAADYQSVVNWLAQQGLALTRRDESHWAVFARGSVRQIQQALQVHFARVALEGKEYTSAITAPRVPPEVAALLAGINGLQPQVRAHRHLRKQFRPNAASGMNGYLPSQIAQAYNATGLYNSNLTGAGQTIAIVIDTFPSTDDLISFWQTANVNQSISNITFIQAVSGELPVPSGEETLDTEWSSAIAPGAKVRIYAATDLAEADLDQAYQQVYNDVTSNPGLNIHQMSMSYGNGESYLPTAQLTTDDQYFAELAAAGVTLFASSGDNGSTPGNTVNSSENGPLEPENPASDPNVTGVGGTTLKLYSSGAVASEVVWNDSSTASAGGGGTSTYFSRPSWQTGTGTSGTMREVPDISCAADPDYGGAVVLNGIPDVYGGTSWACPTCAGFCALMNEARTNAGLSPLGVLGPKIYPLISTTPHIDTGNFTDITNGSNATPFSDGNYNAGIGYDEASGIGTPLVQTLTQTLVGSQTLLSAEVQPSMQMVTPGQNATLKASGNGTPVSYQWQRMPIGSTVWSNLSNTGTYAGSTTATLTVTNVTPAMSGDQFQCLVTYAASKTVTSAPSLLIVDSPVKITTLAGQVGTSGGADGTGTAAEFFFPSGVCVDGGGNLYIADFSNNVIRKVTPAGVVTTPYGSLGGASGSSDGNGNDAFFNGPNGVALDSANNLYVADQSNNLIRKITVSTGAVSTIGGSAFNLPSGVAVDASGNVYVADSGNDVIEKITPGGKVTILAGESGTAGYQDGAGTQAQFAFPTGVAVDASGNVYVADWGNSLVREVTPAGVVSTIAGQQGVSGYQDGLAGQSLFDDPNGIAVDKSGNIYIADCLLPPSGSNAAGNDVLRKITPTGVVSTIAGQPGTAGSADGTGVGAQFFSLQAVAITPSGEFYLTDTFNYTIRAGGIIPFIATPPLAQTVTAGQPVTFSATASGTGPFTYQWYWNNSPIPGATSSSYTILSTSSGNAGLYKVIVSSSFGSVTSIAANLVILTPQTISFAAIPAKVFGVAPFSTSATASSGLAVSFTIVSGPATISNGTVTITGAGTVTVQASQAGNATYAAAMNVEQSFTVAPAAQTITFASLAGKTFGAAPFTVSATASSGLPVTFSIVSGPATISSGTVTITGAGTVVVQASQAGNTNYTAATSVKQSFTVTPAAQTITFASLAGKTFGVAPFTISATASSGLPVTFSVVSGPATISSGTVTITGAGTVIVQASQAGNTNYTAATSVKQSFTVALAAQTITFTTITSQEVGNTVTLNAMASSGLPVSYAVTGSATLSGSTLTLTGAGTVKVTASQAGNANYSKAASVAQSITVTQVPQTITFAAIANQVAGQPLTLGATASSGLAVSYTIISGPATISGQVLTFNAAGTVVVQASQAGNTKYAAATPVKQSITVAKAAQTISFPVIGGQLIGVTVSLSATATSGLTVSYAVTGPATLAGSTLKLTGAGTVTVTASQVGNTAYTAAPEVAQSLTVYSSIQTQTVTFPALANRTFSGTPFALGAMASSGLPISYTSTGPMSISGGMATLTGLGTVKIRASQPGNSAFSAAASVLNTFTVTIGAQTIHFPTLATQVYGAKVTLGATASSGLAITYSVVSGPAELSGTVLTFTGVGTVVVKASQAGNADYSAAPSLTQSLTVNPAPQAITFPAIANRVYPTAAFSTGATASSGLALSYTTNGPVAVSGNILTITGVGTVSIRAHQVGNADYAAAPTVLQSFTVTAAP